MADTLGLIHENNRAIRLFMASNAGKAHGLLKKMGMLETHDRESVIHDALLVLIRRLQLNYVFQIPEAYFFGIVKKMGLKKGKKVIASQEMIK